MDKKLSAELSVSVIIPTFNGEKWLAELLFMLTRQTLIPYEIIIIDSGSSDKTLDIISSYPLKLLQIKQSDFDHGATRTKAGKEAKGDILVYMTQDAILADEHGLLRLVEPFVNDEKIAATYGRQLPVKEASFFARHLRIFNYPDVSEYRCFADKDRYGFKTIFISNSFAAYRKSVISSLGFFPEQVLFGEDSLMLAKILRAGYCVGYIHEAKVYHSHNYSLWQEFCRYFDVGVFHAQHHDLIADFGSVGGSGKAYVKSELSLLVMEKRYYLFPLSCLRILMKYMGYNLGRKYFCLPNFVIKFFSMNKVWWSK